MENTLLNTYLQEEVREGFKIESLEEATWAFRKLRAIENKEADIKATAEKEIAGIESLVLRQEKVPVKLKYFI
ncbi:MAG: hypothetical protein ACLS9F_16120 [Clostridium paraputrificum]